MNNQSPELSGICSKIYRHSPDGDDACIETEDALPLQERVILRTECFHHTVVAVAIYIISVYLSNVLFGNDLIEYLVSTGFK